MATTKTRTTRRAPRSTTSTPRAKSTTTASKQSFTSRTGTAIKNRPVASAAIGTGIVAGIVASVAGFFAFKKSGKTFSEFSGDVATSVKDKAADARTFVKDGVADAKSKAKDLSNRIKDGLDDDKSMTEIAEEALTLKEVGKRKTKTPADPVVAEQTKVGAISY